MANMGDIFTTPMAAPAYPPAYAAPAVIPSGGLGGDGGLVSALVLASVLGKGSFGGDCGRVAVGDPATVASIVAAITANETLSSIGDIKASVPLAEGQVQLALAQAVSQLTETSNSNTNSVLTSLNAAALAAATNAALAARDAAAINTNVASQSMLIQNSIRDDGDKTRALIQSIDKSNDSRTITIQADKIIELENESRRQFDRHGIEINMINNQNQVQAQFQEQRQALRDVTGLCSHLAQSIQATNQAINIGTGTQTANPTNTNTNVRA